MLLWEFIQLIARYNDPNIPIVFDYVDDNGRECELYIDTDMPLNGKIRINLKEVKPRGYTG